ncbi:MAG: 7-carboxy-7-deazaguanine synthase QueE [Bacteroidota bacterium]
MEQFYTLQGEGFHQGRAAYFIRLGGCDVGCHWCDVKDSWDADAHPKMHIDTLVADALKHPGRLAVITGGEPLMHPLGPLTEALQKAGFETNIETSGAHPLSGTWNWICLSPKKFKAPLPGIYTAANELKAIVYNKSDFAFAEQEAAKLSPDCRLYLQPEWSKREEMLPLMSDFVMANPKWRLTLQSHKYIGIP